MLSVGHGVPGSLINLGQVAAWCPRCFRDGRLVPAVEQLDAYLNLLALAYGASPAEVADALRRAERDGRRIAGSAYLGTIVPESADVHNVLGIALAEKRQLDQAIVEFRKAVELDPDSGPAHWHLGAALASQGAHLEATAHLARSVELEPGNSRALSDLGLTLAVQGRLDEAAEHLKRAIALDPQAVDARRTLALVEQRRNRDPARQ
jgi:Flp pilus assembly protein TadD